MPEKFFHIGRQSEQNLFYLQHICAPIFMFCFELFLLWNMDLKPNNQKVNHTVVYYFVMIVICHATNTYGCLFTSLNFFYYISSLVNK